VQWNDGVDSDYFSSRDYARVMIVRAARSGAESGNGLNLNAVRAGRSSAIISWSCEPASLAC
jgi:hypothetical protein